MIEQIELVQKEDNFSNCVKWLVNNMPQGRSDTPSADVIRIQ